jgi:sortase B
MVLLAWFDWVRIGSEEIADMAIVNLRMLDFITSPFATMEILSNALDSMLVGSEQDMELMMWFAGFSTLFFIIVAMFALAAGLTALALIVPGKARNRLAYFGFLLGLITPIVFILASHTVNSQFDNQIMNTTMFPWLSILASVIGLVYCVRFPVLTEDTSRRNGLFTRFVTTFVPVKGDGVREGVRKVIFTTALSCFIYFGSTLGVDLFTEWRANQIRLGLLGDIHAEVDLSDRDFDSIRDANPRYHLELWRRNNDTVGYLEIEGVEQIQYPVLQADDNRYYLRRDFERNQSMGGWIFADHRNNFWSPPGEISRNTVIYGHSLAANGAYFTLLPQYFTTTRDGSLSFYRDNPIIRFNTLWEQMEWKVFAVVLFNTQQELGTVVNYWSTHEFGTPADFHNFVIDIMDRSVLHTDVDLQYGDNLLTLSTCHFPFGRDTASTRSVVFARQLRPGESARSFDTNAAVFNRQAYFGDFPLAARTYGAGERGIWDRRRLLTSYTGV